MSNPVLNRYANTQTMGVSYSAQNYSMQNSALTNVLTKAGIQFAVLIPVAIAAALLIPNNLLMPVSIGSTLAALVLSFAIYMKKTVSVTLIMLYAVLEGLFVGGLSKSYAYLYDGVIVTAIAATTATAGTIILGQRIGFLRTSSRARQIFGYLCLGYIAFGLVSLVAALTGHSFMHLGSPISLAVSIFGVGMASFSLLTDIEDIANVAPNMPEKESWRLGFGLVVSLVWLYLEIVRLVANIMQITRD